MDIAVRSQDGVAVVAPSGVIDTRGSLAFERKLMEVLAGNTRRIVIDLQKVDLITSAGIRVLVMMGKRLGNDGSLVLSGLSPQVKSVFDIAGLTTYFGIAGSVAEAVAAVASGASGQPAVVAGPSRVSRLAMRLLGDDIDAGRGSGIEAGAEHPPSRLTVQIAAVLKDVK